MKKLLGIALMLLCNSVSAQEQKASTKNDIVKGDEYFKDEDYKSARSYYEKAYKNPLLKDTAEMRLRKLRTADPFYELNYIENKLKALEAQHDSGRREYLIKKYGSKKAKMIIDRKVYIGMPANEARDSWGDPDDINRTITSYGTREQWVYGLKNYLYFENGILKTIQN
jgi:hypothetical protein